MTVPFLQDSTFTGLISTQNYGTSREWFDAFNTLSLFIETSSINIQNTTFDSLTSLKSNNNLVPGQFYLINDFELKWRNQGFFDASFLASGVIEPLVVFAITLSSISPIAYSTLHPNDIVFYNIDAKTSIGWGDFPGPGIAIPEFKGWISRRIDQVRNIDIGWDWRYITSNCCKFDVDSLPLYDPATTYNFKAVVRTAAGKIYYSTSDNNINNNVTNISWWLPFSDLTSEADTFFPTNEVGHGYFFNNPLITLAPVLSTRTQLPTFVNPNSSSINNIKITSGFNNRFNDAILFRNCNIGSNFHNNFLLTYFGTGDGFENNSIGNNFNNNIINSAFSNNSIKDNFRYNNAVGLLPGNQPRGLQFCSIGNNFTFNHINYQFTNNIIKDEFRSNIVERSFISNIINDGLQNNFIKNNFTNNNILNNFQNNVINNFFTLNNINNNFRDNNIGTGFTNNNIKDNCINNTFSSNIFFNTIGTNFNDNIISNNFTSNQIGNEFQLNNIGSDCSQNTINNVFVNNTVGDYFEFNSIGNNSFNNQFKDFVNNNKINSNCTDNIFDDNFTLTNLENNITNIDFTGATHVYNNYNKTVFLNANSDIRLSYFNENDQLVVTDPES